MHSVPTKDSQGILFQPFATGFRTTMNNETVEVLESKSGSMEVEVRV